MVYPSCQAAGAGAATGRALSLASRSVRGSRRALLSRRKETPKSARAAGSRPSVEGETRASRRIERLPWRAQLSRRARLASGATPRRTEDLAESRHGWQTFQWGLVRRNSTRCSCGYGAIAPRKRDKSSRRRLAPQCVQPRFRWALHNARVPTRTRVSKARRGKSTRGQAARVAASRLGTWIDDF
jgi:hypothetical protein